MAWYQRFWNVMRSGRVQRDLERELAFHVTERADALQESGMSEADVRARMAVQADRATLLKFADVVVLNDGHSDELHQSVLALWHRLQAGELRRPDGPGPGEA